MFKELLLCSSLLYSFYVIVSIHIMCYNKLMFNRAFYGERFRSVEEQDTVVSEWQRKYESLISTLGTTCTEVLRRRSLEIDSDIPPEFFVRKAVHEFVFPPQPVTLVADESRPSEGTLTHRLTVQDKLYAYDEDKVLGRIRIEYDDGDSHIRFVMRDMMERSIVDDQTTAALSVFDELTKPI